MRFWITPWLISTIAVTIESGSRTYRQVRIRSCQKFPSDVAAAADDAADQGDRDQIPTAAEAKFWTVSPAIWLK